MNLSENSRFHHDLDSNHKFKYNNLKYPRVLLINPALNVTRDNFIDQWPPIGLGYLKEFLERKGSILHPRYTPLMRKL